MEADHTADLMALEATSDDRTRNEIALRLADQRAPGAPEVLLRLIAREDLTNRREMLVHSLGQFDCSSYVPVLVHLVATGNWEVAHEAFRILARIEQATGPDLSAAYAETRAALSAAAVEDWRCELLGDLLSGFD